MTADEMAELMATGSVRSRPIPIGVVVNGVLVTPESLGKPAVDTSTEVGREEGTEAVGSISKR